MITFKTIGDYKSWAIDAWLNKKGKYYSSISDIHYWNTFNKEMLLKMLHVLHEKQRSDGKSFFHIENERRYPYVIGTDYGILIIVSYTKRLTIKWEELIKYCVMKYNTLNLDKFDNP